MSLKDDKGDLNDDVISVLQVWQNCACYFSSPTGVENSTRILCWLLTHEKSPKAGSITYSLFTKNTFLYIRETHHKRQGRRYWCYLKL